MCYTISLPSRFVQTFFAVPLVLLMWACGGSTNPPTPTATVSAIDLIANSSPGIPVGGTVHAVAIGEYQSDIDFTTHDDVSQTATWSTSNSAVATVSKGIINGVGIGRATITASLQGRTDTILIVVGQTPSLAIEAKDSLYGAAYPSSD
jgi:hypothetical protein